MPSYLKVQDEHFFQHHQIEVANAYDDSCVVLLGDCKLLTLRSGESFGELKRTFSWLHGQYVQKYVKAWVIKING